MCRRLCRILRHISILQREPCATQFFHGRCDILCVCDIFSSLSLRHEILRHIFATSSATQIVRHHSPTQKSLECDLNDCILSFRTRTICCTKESSCTCAKES